jgi:hypothetical protein
MYPVRRPDTSSTQQRQKGVRPLFRSAIPRERHNYRHTQVYVFHKHFRISKDTSTDVIHNKNQK